MPCPLRLSNPEKFTMRKCLPLCYQVRTPAAPLARPCRCKAHRLAERHVRFALNSAVTRYRERHSVIHATRRRPLWRLCPRSLLWRTSLRSASATTFGTIVTSSSPDDSDAWGGRAEGFEYGGHKLSAMLAKEMKRMPSAIRYNMGHEPSQSTSVADATSGRIPSQHAPHETDGRCIPQALLVRPCAELSARWLKGPSSAVTPPVPIW